MNPLFRWLGWPRRTNESDAETSIARQLTARYIFSLSAVALLAVAGQFSVQSLLRLQESDARVVNLAGRQRMLSQRLAKAALQPRDSVQRKALTVSIDNLVRVHQGLQKGDPALGLPGHNSPAIRDLFAELQPQFEGLVAGVEQLLKADDEARQRAARAQIERYEGRFAETMDDIVFRFDGEAQRRVIRIVRLELTLMVLMLVVLFLEAVFVFRPAVVRLESTLTGLVRTRNALARTESEQQATLQAIPDGLVRVSGDGGLFILKAVGSRLFGQAVPSGVRIEPEQFPETVQAALDTCRSQVRSGQAVGSARALVHPGDEVAAYELRLAPAQGTGQVLMVRDITEQHRLEAEVLDATERARARVGRELHDGLCQHLAGIALMARAQATNPASEEMVRLLDDGVAQARQLALGLYPATLANLGLEGALEELIRHTEVVSPLQCSLELPDDPVDLPNEPALQLFRIAQEATANVIKHARATRVSVRLTGAPTELCLEIEDDGQGFDGQASRRGGLGLDTMAYRAKSINAELLITTSMSTGTLVRCCLRPTSGLEPSRGKLG